MAKRQVWVVELKRRKLWDMQASFEGYQAKHRANGYLRHFREVNPGIEAKLTKYIPAPEAERRGKEK